MISQSSWRGGRQYSQIWKKGGKNNPRFFSSPAAWYLWHLRLFVFCFFCCCMWYGNITWLYYQIFKISTCTGLIFNQIDWKRVIERESFLNWIVCLIEVWLVRSFTGILPWVGRWRRAPQIWRGATDRLDCKYR